MRWPCRETVRVQLILRFLIFGSPRPLDRSSNRLLPTMASRRFIVRELSTSFTLSTTPPTARSHARNPAYVKRTYLIRVDQEEALKVALARAELGQEQRLQGRQQSQIIEALLDQGGFNQDYVDGHGRLRL